MKVDAKLVTEVSSIMKLQFSETETNELVTELNHAFAMLSALSEVDTEGVTPTHYGGLGEAVFRKDEPIANHEQVKAMLAQVRASENHMIEVPAMIDDGGAGA